MSRSFCDCDCDFLTEVRKSQRFLGLAPPKMLVPSQRALRLCFLCLVRCLLPFYAVLLFLGSFFENIFGSEFLFLGLGVGLVFCGGFLPMFLLYFWRFAPESVWKKIS